MGNAGVFVNFAKGVLNLAHDGYWGAGKDGGAVEDTGGKCGFGNQGYLEGGRRAEGIEGVDGMWTEELNTGRLEDLLDGPIIGGFIELYKLFYTRYLASIRWRV